MLFLFLPARLRERFGKRWRIVFGAFAPDHQVGFVNSFQLQNARIMRARGRPARVGQIDDFCLKPFGGVNRHHAHGFSRRLHVAPDRKISAAQPVQEGHERGRLKRLGVQRQFQKLVHRVASLRPKTGEEPSAAFFWPQQARVKPERTFARALAPAVYPRHRIYAARLRASAQRVNQRAATTGRKFQQIVVVEANERRFQDAGQREIILREKRNASSRHKILHRDMVAQFQTIRARHRHACFFERPDDALKKRTPLAHKNQHVASAHAPQAAVFFMHRLA